MHTCSRTCSASRKACLKGSLALCMQQAQQALPSVDAAALQRVYNFLDHWGIINFEADGGSGLPAFELAPVGQRRCHPHLALCPGHC